MCERKFVLRVGGFQIVGLHLDVDDRAQTDCRQFEAGKIDASAIDKRVEVECEDRIAKLTVCDAVRKAVLARCALDRYDFFACRSRRDIDAEVQTIAETYVDARLCCAGNVLIITRCVVYVVVAFFTESCARVRRLFLFGEKFVLTSLASNKDITDVGEQVFAIIETADLHYLAIDDVDKVRIELQ